jgi:hypothetical protein
MRKICLAVLFGLIFSAVECPVFAAAQYEYKILSLGSLTGIQKSDAQGKIDEIEKQLNAEGGEGWEIVSTFAVRTTFDPNFVLVFLKRVIETHDEN